MTDHHTHEEIRRIAYGLWTEAGQPEGRDREHWEAAKEIWAFRNREEMPQEAVPQDAAPSADASVRSRKAGSAETSITANRRKSGSDVQSGRVQ